MFTGLVEEIGTVRRITVSADGASIDVAAKTVLSDLKIGDSVAVSGPCLTVTALAGDGFTAYVMPETLKKTNLGNLSAGSEVNLERALSLNARLGGHMVSGHIDAAVDLIDRQREGGAILLTFNCLPDLMRYIVPKGSVALDGVSLTVAAVGEDRFTVGVIPHTADQTTVGRRKIGDRFNLEVDLLGKYVEKMLSPFTGGEKSEKSKISLAFLQEQGYI